MATTPDNKATVSGNTTNPWIKLGKGLNMIHITCAAWGGASAALQASKDGEDANAAVVTQDGTAVVATENMARMVYGDGDSHIRISVSSYGGSPITIECKTCMYPG